jgi:hypothetical protein
MTTQEGAPLPEKTGTPNETEVLAETRVGELIDWLHDERGNTGHFDPDMPPPAEVAVRSQDAAPPGLTLYAQGVQRYLTARAQGKRHAVHLKRNGFNTVDEYFVQTGQKQL